MDQPLAGAALTPDGHPPRIMIIEDEPLIAMGLKMVLENMGCEVAATVDNAHDAVATAEADSFDLVLADVRLRGSEDGIWAIQNILSRRKVRVLFVTGNASEVSARGMGHIDILSKPFMPAALERSIRAILSRC